MFKACTPAGSGTSSLGQRRGGGARVWGRHTERKHNQIEGGEKMLLKAIIKKELSTKF